MLTKEEQLLELRVTGLADIEKAKKAIRDEEAAIRDAREELRKKTITHADYEAAVKRSAAAVAASNQTIAAAQTQTRDYRQNMMALGYVFNDFFSVTGGIQQRLNAIANNMPMLLAGAGALGGTLGALLPVIGMLAPALFVAFKSWGGDIDVAIGHVERLKATIKEFEKNPPKLAMDMRRLEDAKEMLDEITENLAVLKRWENERPATEKEIGGSVAETLREQVGGPKAKQILLDQMTPGAMASDVELQRLDNLRQEKEAKAAEAQKTLDDPSTDPETAIMLPLEIMDLKKQIKGIADKREARRVAIDKEVDNTAGGLLKRAERGEADAVEELGNRIEAAGLSETEGGQDSILMEAGANIRNARSNLEIKRKDKIARENWEKEKAEASAAETKRAADEAEQVQRNEADAAQVIAEDRAKQSGIEATRAKHDAQGRTERQRRIKEQVDAASGTELGEQATAAAGIYRAQGGYTDERGRKHKLDEPAQVADLMSQLEKRLQAMNPKADKGETREAALAMANRAFATVDAGKAAGESGAGIASDAVAKYMETIQRTNAEQAAELQRVNALFGSGAAAAEQQRMMMENRFRAQQVQSFSYMPGAW